MARVEVRVFAVGQGNSNVIEYYDDDGKLAYLAMIDCGGESDVVDLGLIQHVKNKMAERGGGTMSIIDDIIVTHQDTDHWDLFDWLFVQVFGGDKMKVIVSVNGSLTTRYFREFSCLAPQGSCSVSEYYRREDNSVTPANVSYSFEQKFFTPCGISGATVCPKDNLKMKGDPAEYIKVDLSGNTRIGEMFCRKAVTADTVTYFQMKVYEEFSYIIIPPNYAARSMTVEYVLPGTDDIKKLTIINDATGVTVSITPVPPGIYHPGPFGGVANIQQYISVQMSATLSGAHICNASVFAPMITSIINAMGIISGITSPVIDGKLTGATGQAFINRLLVSGELRTNSHVRFLNRTSKYCNTQGFLDVPTIHGGSMAVFERLGVRLSMIYRQQFVTRTRTKGLFPNYPGEDTNSMAASNDSIIKNGSSVVSLLEVNNTTRFVFTGDLNTHTMYGMLNPAEPLANTQNCVMTAPHHGSSKSSIDDRIFLGAALRVENNLLSRLMTQMGPSTIVSSAGFKNKHKHPGNRFIRRAGDYLQGRALPAVFPHTLNVADDKSTGAKDTWTWYSFETVLPVYNTVENSNPVPSGRSFSCTDSNYVTHIFKAEIGAAVPGWEHLLERYAPFKTTFNRYFNALTDIPLNVTRLENSVHETAVPDKDLFIEF